MYTGIQFQYQADKEVDYCINLVKPKITFFSERFKDKAKLRSIKKLPSIIYGLKYENLISKAIPYAGPSLGSGEDILVILFTSGTTGNPKGAKISHMSFYCEMLCIGLMNIRLMIKFSCMGISSFHMASTDLAIGSLIIGASVAFVDGFEPKVLKRLIQKYKLSWKDLSCKVRALHLNKLKEKKLKLRELKLWEQWQI